MRTNTSPKRKRGIDSNENVAPFVLHVRGVTGYGGGPEKTILNSPRFLRSLGYRCECAYMHPPTDGSFENLSKRAQRAQADLVSIPDRGAWDWRVLSSLIKTCRQRRVAIWHGHDYKSNVFGLIARRFWPMKLVTTVHGWVEHTRRTPVYYAIDRFCLARLDEVICVSDDLHQSCLEYGVRSDRCRWIANAIDDDEFKRQIPRPVMASAEGKPLLLGSMGRLSNEKGFDLLIQAIAELNSAGLACRLQIAGEGPERSELARMIQSLSCKGQVELLGQVSDVKAFFESLDAFVLSSRREGLPNVLLEAMAMEVPVVATRIAGIPKLIESGRSGILVESESVEELKRGIRVLVIDSALRDRLAEEGRKTIEQSFSFRRRMERIAAVYDQVLGKAH
jgi:glycosyltransferase involved in cell wall biosynthesis